MQTSLRCALALSLLVGGCGGKVVFDGAGGGAGGGGAGGGTSSGALASVSSSSGGDAGAACDAFCAAEKKAGCKVPALGCVETCQIEQSYLGACGKVGLALRKCMVKQGFPSSPQCIDFTGCKAEQSALEACEYPSGVCDMGACTSSQGDVACVRTCGPHTYRTKCSVASPHACVCSVDDAVVGSCTDQLATSGGCCIAFFSATKG